MRNPASLFNTLVMAAYGLVIPGTWPVYGQALPTTPVQNDTETENPFDGLLHGLPGIKENPNTDAVGSNKKRLSSPGQTSSSKSPQAVSPLQNVQRAMRTAAESLEGGVLTGVTQSAQERAIESLDQLLQQAALQHKTSQSNPSTDHATPARSTGNSDSDPSKNSAASSSHSSATPSASPGQASEDPFTNTKSSPSKSVDSSIWGHLPSRMRERLQATVPQDYLPAYRQAIHDYFTRISRMPRVDP